MAVTKKQQIRGVRILLTVFYGFLLSSILSHYLLHGIIETIRRPTPISIAMIVLGGIILISISLAIYATWFENTIIMLVSGIVLIAVFVLTLVFGILRIVKAAPNRLVPATTASSAVLLTDDLSEAAAQITSVNQNVVTTDTYALAEDVTKLIIELVFILFAILATFILHRYVKAKYAAVPTSETTTK